VRDPAPPPRIGLGPPLPGRVGSSDVVKDYVQVD
jgi:hypothetical protein